MHPGTLPKLANRDIDLNRSSTKESSEVHQGAVGAQRERAEQGHKGGRRHWSCDFEPGWSLVTFSECSVVWQPLAWLFSEECRKQLVLSSLCLSFVCVFTLYYSPCVGQHQTLCYLDKSLILLSLPEFWIYFKPINHTLAFYTLLYLVYSCHGPFTDHPPLHLQFYCAHFMFLKALFSYLM